MEEAGFDVAGASSAAKGIAVFDAEPERFKALVTDIRLGSGKTGWEVARHVRRVNPAIPVVYVSGDSAVHWASEGVPNSIMITKPFFMPQIISALAALLNEQQPLPES